MPTPTTIPLPGSLELCCRIAGEDLTVRLARKTKVACDPLAMATANAAVVALRGNELCVGKARFWIPADSLVIARAIVAQLERTP